MSRPVRDHRDDDGFPSFPRPPIPQRDNPQLLIAEDFTYNSFVSLGLCKNYRYLHVNKEFWGEGGGVSNGTDRADS